jgi:hypothetical protein
MGARVVDVTGLGFDIETWMTPNALPNAYRASVDRVANADNLTAVEDFDKRLGAQEDRVMVAADLLWPIREVNISLIVGLDNPRRRNVIEWWFLEISQRQQRFVMARKQRD